MMYFVFFLIMLCCVNVVLLYIACIIAGEYDRRSEAVFEKYQAEKRKNEFLVKNIKEFKET